MSITTISQLSQSISLAGTDKFALDSSIGTFNTTLDSMSMYMEQSVSYTTTQSILAGDRIKLNRSGTIYTIQPGTSILKDIAVVGTASSNQVVIGSDSRLYDSRYPTFHSHSIDDTYLLRSELDKRILNLSIGTPNGIASLDCAGKLNVNQVPDSLKGQVLYKGTWNAYSNMPNLSDTSGLNKASNVKGNYYVVTNGGTINFGGTNILEFVVGDWVISNGSKWQKVNNADGIVSINGKTGRVVVLDATEIPNVVNVSGSTMIGPLMMSGGTNVQLTAGTGYFFIGNTSSVHIATDTNSIQAKNSGTTSDLYINELGGNVGIGTIIPSAKLHVNGGIVVSEGSTGGSSGYGFVGDGGLDTGMFSPSDGYLKLYSDNIERLSINSTGNINLTGSVNVNGNVNVKNGYIETPYIEVTAPGSTYCYIDVGNANSPGAIIGDYSVRIDSNAAIISSTGYNLQLSSGAGTIIANNTFACRGDIIAFYSSDRQLKDNVKNIENPIEKIKKINGVSFDWNDKQNVYTGHDIGVIAQEVEEVLPEIVTTRDNGYKAVKYEKLVALLIEGIKDLQSQIDELKKGK